MARQISAATPVGLAQTVLRVLALFGPRVADRGVTEVARALGCYKSRAHRALRLLEQERFLQRRPSSGRYALGPRAYELGRAATDQFSPAELAGPFLEALARAVRATALLRTLTGGEVLTVALCESPEAVKVSLQRGSWAPFNYGATGKVLCAALPEAEVSRLIREHGLQRLTPKTITNPTRFRQELALVRRRGYAFSDEEALPGVRGVAAPVFGPGGEILAALGVTLPAAQLPLRRLPAVVRAVRRAAAGLSAALGAPASGGRAASAAGPA